MPYTFKARYSSSSPRRSPTGNARGFQTSISNFFRRGAGGGSASRDNSGSGGSSSSGGGGGGSTSR